MGVPSTFKAAYVEEAGGKTIIKDRSLPQLKPGEVAIKIKAASINPIDWKLRDYPAFAAFAGGYPLILGTEAAGEVVAVGPDVSDVKEGNRVFFQGNIGDPDSRTLQEYCIMPAPLLAKTPDSLSDEQAASIFLASVAALVGLYDTSAYELRPLPWEQGGDKAGEGKAIVIVGGSSSVGQYAIQLAKLSGFSKIITNASAANLDLLKKLGATTVLDRAKEGSADHFAAAVGDMPLGCVFDAISIEETQIQAVQILQAVAKVEKPYIIFLDPADPTPAIVEQMKKGREVEIKKVVGLGSLPHLRYLSEPFAAAIGGEDGYIAKGKYLPNRPLVVPGGLEALDEALNKNKNGVSGVKVIIKLNE